MAEQQLRYDGRVAVITGAGAGLGREYALLLASRGAKVVVNDLGGSHLGEGASNRAANIVVEEIKALGGIAVPDYNSVVEGEKIVETAIRHFGRIDILINNAGILRDRSLLKISDDDWNLVHDVHLKGSFKCTQAAFPHMKKQNYGRIVMTSSHSGVYGNFGQANYSAAKMGLLGLANTVAIEGAKYNINCNAIIPTAASRMTKDVLPEELFQELKPKLIAPVVVYMCHETCEDTGAYIESAAGFAAKLHFVRGNGALLRSNIQEDSIPLEAVKNAWYKVTDMSEAKRLDNMREATGSLMQTLEQLRDGRAAGPIDSFRYTSRDVIVYALGVGATTQNPSDMRFLYENDADFSVIPSYLIQPSLMQTMASGIVAAALPSDKQVDFTRILHGEQYLEICDDIPNSATLFTSSKVCDVMDKGSGALVVVNSESFTEDDTLLVKAQSAVFVVGAGNFSGKRTPSAEVVPTMPPPSRKPDATVQYKTCPDQAALYRLSGDFNPLHIDEQIAKMAGRDTPILHGLCTLGYSVRAVLATFANNNTSMFKAIKVRFAAPVLPGQTLKVDMWRQGKRIHFVTSVAETGKEVLTGAYVDLKDIIISKL